MIPEEVRNDHESGSFAHPLRDHQPRSSAADRLPQLQYRGGEIGRGPEGRTDEDRLSGQVIHLIDPDIV